MNGKICLDDNITVLDKIGRKRAELYAKLGVSTVRDLLELFPRAYLDFTSPVPINQTVLNENNIICGQIIKKMSPQRIKGGMVIFKAVMTDGESDITIVIYNSEYMFNRLCVGKEYLLFGKITGNMVRREISSPMIVDASTEHKILPVYPLTQGLSQPMLRLTVEQALKSIDDELIDDVPKDIQQRNELCALRFAYNNIHFPADSHSLEISKQRLVFDEIFRLMLGMSMLKSRSKEATGCVMKAHSIADFNNSLPFKMTDAQNRAVSECIADMQNTAPMNRLLQGDVGSGKTAVAAACAYFVYKNGYQTALMAPTEILASQHFSTLESFLAPLGVKVTLLTGSMTAAQKTQVRKEIQSGECTVVVGTHALFQEKVVFDKLGLAITDEQHRFGVNQRSSLANKGDNPHRLVMSATPIPRTLALMIFGDLDISVLDELPKGRQPIETYAITGANLRERAYGFVRERLNEGRQAYIVCPLIEESEMPLHSVTEYATQISQGILKDYRIGLLHGKMPPVEKDEIMKQFKAHQLDVLVSTTVIEVGVDVPNAAVMVIENAERFGLSQLHQLRGRIGRGNHKSYCILITDNVTDECRKRLKILSSTSDGFKISEEDLRLRGPGEFFGSRQHGLPQMKIASLADDIDIIKLAQDEAHKLLQKDRKLTLPEHTGLNKSVQKLFSSGSDL